MKIPVCIIGRIYRNIFGTESISAGCPCTNGRISITIVIYKRRTTGFQVVIIFPGNLISVERIIRTTSICIDEIIIIDVNICSGIEINISTICTGIGSAINIYIIEIDFYFLCIICVNTCIGIINIILSYIDKIIKNLTAVILLW